MSTLQASALGGNAGAVHTSNLKGWWSLAKHSDPILDRSGNAQDMDLIEGAVANIDGTAYKFEYQAAAANGAFGHDATLDLSDLDINDSNTNFVLHCRVNIASSSATGNGAIMGKSSGGTGKGCWLQYSNGIFAYLSDGVSRMTTTGVYSDATDYQVDVIVNRTDTGIQTILVDGVSKGTSSSIPIEATDMSDIPFTIGGRGKTGTVNQNLDGTGDVILVWDCQLYMTTDDLPSNIETLLGNLSDGEAISLADW